MESPFGKLQHPGWVSCPESISQIDFSGVEHVQGAELYRTEVGAFVRKERWASKAKARESLKEKMVFKRWDERCLDKYVEFGTIELLDGTGVRLKTRPKNEAILAVSVHEGAVAVYPSFPPYSPSIIYGPKKGAPFWTTSRSPIRCVRFRMPRSRVEEGAHLLVQENPAGTAEEVAKFLKKTYPTISKGKEGRLSGKARL